MLQFEQLLKNNNLERKDLPKEIKNKIQVLTMTVGRANKAPEDKIKQDKVRQEDLLICNAIQNFIEKDLPTYEEFATQTPKAVAAKDGYTKRTQDVSLQTAVVNKINDCRGRWITANDLSAILGRSPGKTEVIGDITLYRVYLTDKYKVK